EWVDRITGSVANHQCVTDSRDCVRIVDDAKTRSIVGGVLQGTRETSPPSGRGCPWPLQNGASAMRIFRILALLISVVGLGFIGRSQAVAAGGAVSVTTTEHGATDTFVDVVPCGIDEA